MTNLIIFIKRRPYKVQQQESAPQQIIQAAIQDTTETKYPSTLPSSSGQELPSNFCTIIQSHKPSLTINTSNSRQSSPLPSQLGADNIRPLGSKGSERVSPGLHPPSLSAISTSHNSQVAHRTATDRGGGEHSSGAAGSDQGQP